MSSPTKLRQMAKELGWPPELEKAADQLQKLKRENAALREELERLEYEVKEYRAKYWELLIKEEKEMLTNKRKKAQP